MDYGFSTAKTAVITFGVVGAILGSIALGVSGNNAADRSHERVAVACVKSGGQWLLAPGSADRECKR